MIDRQLLSLLGRDTKYIYLTVALMLVGMLANIGFTGCVCYSLWLTLGDEPASSYCLPGLMAALCLIVRFLCTCKAGEVRDALGRKAKKNLREKVYGKILALGSNSTKDLGMAGLTQVALEGIEQLDLYYSQYLPQFFYALSAPIVLFMATVWIDWHVATALLCCVPLIPLSIIAVSRYAKKIFGKYWSRYTSMGDKFHDSVQGLKELKIFRADAEMHEKINRNAEDFRRITMKVLTMQLMSTTIMDLMAYGGAALGVAIALLGVINLSIGPMAGLFLMLTAAEFFLPLRAFGSAFHVAMNGAGAGRKIASLLHIAEPKWGNKMPVSAGIDIKHVTFLYNGKRAVLKDVSMTFPSKGVTAIVGKSGCGKSTVVNLMQGLYQPASGEIILGGIPICELQRAAYYRRLSVVSYNSYVFNSTIRENFKMAKPDVTDNEIYHFLSKVNLDEFVRQNGGLDRIIEEDAANFSGGQKQRLALAINLIADKDIYVLDEATSNIDIESEEIIMKALKNLGRTKCVIIISHRLANITDADRIYFMENGEVSEYGTHEDMMTAGKGYSRLYRSQKKLEKGCVA